MISNLGEKTLKLIAAASVSGAAGAEIIEGLWGQEGTKVLVALVVLVLALYVVKLIEDMILKENQ